jgi:hypothetical protein
MPLGEGSIMEAALRAIVRFSSLELGKVLFPHHRLRMRCAK